MFKVVDPKYFLDADRLDFMCKYLYVKSKSEGSNHRHYKSIYEEHIFKQTRGLEPTDMHIINQPRKNTVKDYTDSFDRLINNFKTHGYNQDYPIHCNSIKRINSGAHRIACALYYKQQIPIVMHNDTETKHIWDRAWFESHSFPEEIIIELEETFVKLSCNR